MGNRIYDLKQIEAVAEYIREKKYFEEACMIEDISTGNMNYVYRIKEIYSGKSRILKYAAEHTRISEDILVSPERIRIEARVLFELNQHVQQYVPHIYHYDDSNRCILMEDYGEYSILRDKLNQCEIIPELTENITSYLVESIMPTLNVEINDELSNKDIRNMVNPLCETTRTFVFSEPFNQYSNTNDIYELSMNYIVSEVFHDKELLMRIDELKEQFMSKKQALLHGDLHTGSVFVNENSVILFDYEFAFYGPIGFDIGNLIANLIFSWLHAKALGSNEVFMHWLENTIDQLINSFKKSFISEYAARYGTSAIYPTEGLSSYVDDIIRDTAAFAGVELIRRVIGVAHVKDIISIEMPQKRAEAEVSAIKLAKRFIFNNKNFKYGEDFINEMIKL